MNTDPLFALAQRLGVSYGDNDPRGHEAVKVTSALTDDRVLAAIAERTNLQPDAVVEHLVAMARMLTKERA